MIELARLFNLKPEEEKRLNPQALLRIIDWESRILKKMPQLYQLNVEEVIADLDAFLDSNDKTRFKKYVADISEWLSECMDAGERYCSRAYATWVTNPMFEIEWLISKAYRLKAERAEAQQKEKEAEQRWQLAYEAVNPPLADVEKYLSHEERDAFVKAARQAILVYSHKGEDYLADWRTVEYTWWLNKIQERKKEEAQKLRAAAAASEYNHRLNQEMGKLTSRLDRKQKDLASYFRGQIQDQRHTTHNFDFVLSKKDEMNLDRVLVTVANERLRQLLSGDLRHFIVLPSQYYRLYFPLPVASYSFEEVPCIDFGFEIFAAAYAEVWLKPGKKSFDGYEFPLPWIEEKNDLTLLEKPRFLGYYHLILRPEDFGDNIFWQTIPLVLIRGLLAGDTKPDGTTISAASDSDTTYKVQKFEDEVGIPDRFAEYLRSIGSVDGMVGTGVITGKVANIVKSVLGELEGKREIPPAREKTRGKDSNKEKAFQLFDEGKRPSDPEVKGLGIKPGSAYRYYQAWKQTRSHSPV